MAIANQISTIQNELKPYDTELIVVTKTRSIAQLTETYAAGIKDFGENRVQEMVEKQAQLPSDIRWHQIGHLQTNKVKYIAPFIHLIHSVDSMKLLKEINAQAQRNNRVIQCLLQLFVAQEETKFGLDENEAITILKDPMLAELQHIQIIGVMAMATNTENVAQIEQEFNQVKSIFERFKSKQLGVDSGRVDWKEISIGMSNDYLMAAKAGSTLVRVGSAIFAQKN